MTIGRQTWAEKLDAAENGQEFGLVLGELLAALAAPSSDDE